MNQNELAAIEKISTMLSCVCNAIGNAQAEQTAALERIAAALEAGQGAAGAAQLDGGDVSLLEPESMSNEDNDEKEQAA